MHLPLALAAALVGVPAPSQVADPSPAADPARRLLATMKWLRSTHPYGHTGLLMVAGGLVVYLDPVDLVNRDLPPADIILVSHDHADHFSPATIGKLATPATTVVSIPAVAAALRTHTTISLAPGDRTKVGPVEIEAVPAFNDTHPAAARYLGFVVTVGGVRVYLSGDTALHEALLSIPRLDIAVLNVRRRYALSGEEGVTFARAVRPRFLVPIHWMPDDDSYGDRAEVAVIQRDTPVSTEVVVLPLH